MFFLDELIYNVYSKFSHWMEEKKKNNNWIYSQFIIYSCSFVFQIIQIWGFITVDESSLLLMINVQTVHKYTIKERLSVCDCNSDFPVSDAQESRCPITLNFPIAFSFPMY